MKVAIMQPYLFPYIGYFQLIVSADVFVLYDNIKYTKKGWINRNRFLRDGADVMFSVPLKKDSDLLEIRDRTIAADFKKEKLLNQFKEAYRRAPHFQEVFPVLQRFILQEEPNLFKFLHKGITDICTYLSIGTKIVISSELPIDHSLQAQDKVLALCQYLSADTYINAIGGQELYSKEIFRVNGVDLRFLKSKPFRYAQLGNEFIPWLSILDVIMFNSRDTMTRILKEEYELL